MLNRPVCIISLWQSKLIEHGHMVVYVTNEAIKKNRSLLDGRWDKNDTKDAANVADLISQGKCNYYDLPRMPIRELRSLLLLRKRLKEAASQLPGAHPQQPGRTVLSGARQILESGRRRKPGHSALVFVSRENSIFGIRRLF